MNLALARFRMALAGFALALLVSPIRSADAFMGRCVLEVDHHSYLHGPCNIELLGDGSFSIGTGERNRSRYFAYVEVDKSSGKASGSWNGANGASHAHDDLGQLSRHGACWTNARAKVCAMR